MGIAVRVVFAAHQRFLLGQERQNGLVGLRLASLGQGGFAHQRLRQLLFAGQVGRGGQTAFVVHRAVNGQSDTQAQLIVVHAVARSDVHEAGAGGVVDEVGREQPSGALAEGVLVLERRQLFGLGGADDLIAFPPTLLAQAGQ